MRLACLLALVGIVHVHHAPSHDSRAPFEEVLKGAQSAGLDFLVLSDHVESDVDLPLPAAERAGLYTDAEGRELLVLVGAELGTEDGHLLTFAVDQAYASKDRPGREVIDRVHGGGGFAVIAHPFSHGGWRDWEAPFDGMEVHNHATAMRRMLGPLLPFRLIQFAVDRDSVFARMLRRPTPELERWEAILEQGRPVVAFSGADAHQNVSLLGWQLDPYARMFELVQTVCPDGELTPEWIWGALRQGRCSIRYSLYSDRASEAVEVRFPSGRVELQLDDGLRVYEIKNPPPSSPR
jgi:hypothetical protein